MTCPVVSVKNSPNFCLCHHSVSVCACERGDLHQVQTCGCTRFSSRWKSVLTFSMISQKNYQGLPVSKCPDRSWLWEISPYNTQFHNLPIYPWHLGNVTNRWFHLVCAVVSPSASLKQALALYAGLFLYLKSYWASWKCCVVINHHVLVEEKTTFCIVSMSGPSGEAAGHYK